MIISKDFTIADLAPAIELIKYFEGCKLQAYLCPAGKKTVGYGHVILEGEYLDKITQKQAEDILSKDVMKHASKIFVLIKYSYMTSNEFSALVSFAFNLGVSALKGSTLLKFYNKGELKLASREFDKWVIAGGKKLEGLVKRREKEKELFLT